MSRHHNFDIKPIPEKIIYINEDTITGSREASYSSDEDNVRVYVPLNISKRSLLQELDELRCRLGDATYENEYQYFEEVDRIREKLEIYDQKWFIHEHKCGIGLHSDHAAKVAEEMVRILRGMSDSSTADTFPYESIDELCDEYGIEKQE